MNLLNILLVDSHQIIIDGIKSLLQNEKNINVVASALNTDQALELLQDHQQINMVISETELPQENGLFLLKRVKELNPTIYFMFLSTALNKGYAMQALEYGAEGYVMKDTSMNTLVSAIRDIVQSNICYDRRVSDLLLKELMNRRLPQDQVPEVTKNLTSREKEILVLVTEGMSNADIAEKLKISIRTVENHRANILRKVRVKNTAELVNFVLKHNLLSQDV